MDFMKLIFKIISNPENGVLSDNCKVFDSTLSTIGRSHNSDWVLPDPERFISSKHAEIHLRNNIFYIKDISSNGIIDAESNEAIGKNQELPISNNQKFLIGEYLIQAELENSANQVADPESQAIADEHAQWENQMDDFWGNSSDPLDLLASNQPKTNNTSDIHEAIPSLSNAIERTPAFKQAMSFAPSDLIPAADTDLIESDQRHQTESSSGIPENWDNTSFSLPEKVKAEASIAKPLASNSIKSEPSRHEMSEDDAFFEGLETDNFFAEEMNNDIGTPVHAEVLHEQAIKEPESALKAPAKFTRPESTRPRKRQPSTPTNSNNKLLDAAKVAFKKQGIDEKLLTEESALQWLELMPTVIQGTLDLLQARAAIKNEFRVSKTLLNTSENNPLKFSVNAEDAILSLFHQNRPGFQSAQPAFEQAFSDINMHQSALLHGVRVAMMGLLKQFDAELLEKEFTSSHQSTNFLDKLGSSKAAQAKLWQQYKDLYNNEYKIDSDDSFQRIFGENFADAYSEFSSDV